MKIKDLEKKYTKSLEMDYSNKDDVALELGLMVATARINVGVTQKELAERIGTKQSSIARIENGFSEASNSFLAKVAEALDVKFKLTKFDLKMEVRTEAKNVGTIFTRAPATLSAGLNYVIAALSKAIPQSNFSRIK